MANKENSLPLVTFYYRKQRAVGNYSVEFIFRDVAARLRGKIIPRPATSSYESKGFLKRIYISLEAIRRQGNVNHVTGDINFVGIFLKKRKTIQTILDCGQVHASKGIKRTILKLFWLTIPVRRCRYVTAISSATKEEILKYVPVDPEKIVVIPVAISDSFKRFDKPFNKVNPRILQIGTAPNKNLERLIEALKDLKCVLVIIGKHNPVYEEKLKANQTPYFYLSGLSDLEMKAQYQQADIVVLPSTYEGFGMPIIEAQSVGRVVLTANLSSMPEIGGDAACFVDPYQISEIRNGILKLISDDAYREGLIQKGFENIKRYNPDKIANEYFELYTKITRKN